MAGRIYIGAVADSGSVPTPEDIISFQPSIAYRDNSV